jgi:general secretion pathway protein G
MTGIIAAIAIPNFLNAVQRGKQKRTMADIRAVATAVEAYAADQGSYPIAEDVGELRLLLEPTYVPRLPVTDGWQHSLRYQAWGEAQGVGGASDYAIVSPGKDGQLEQTDFSWYESGSTRRFDRDIVFGNGRFVLYPEGAQR